MDYDFEAKQTRYRVPAWAAVDRMCRTPRGLRRVAVLDTPQGLEVRHLVRIGYRPENILVVNFSAAQLAAMTKALRADGIEGVRTKAGEFTDVLMKWDEPPHVISFDTTSNLVADAYAEIHGCVLAHDPECVTGVSLAGREDAAVGAALRIVADRQSPHRDSLNQDVNPTHYARVLIASGFVGAKGPLRWARYMSSSGQPMVWFVFGRGSGWGDLSPVISDFRQAIGEYRRIGAELRALRRQLAELESA